MLFIDSFSADCPIRQKIRDFYRIDENIAVDYILPLTEVNVSAQSRAWERARKMALQIRIDESVKGAIDALLKEYTLSSEEGVVLMCWTNLLLKVYRANACKLIVNSKQHRSMNR